MTTPTRGGRTGSDWGADIAAALLLTVREVQALVCAAVLAGAAALAYQGRDELRPDPPAPSSPYRGTYGQCFSGGDDHECPAG